MGAFGGCHINDSFKLLFDETRGWSVQLCLLCRKAYYGHTYFELMMCWGGQFICPKRDSWKENLAH